MVVPPELLIDTEQTAAGQPPVGGPYRPQHDPLSYLGDAGEDDPYNRKDVEACCAANKNEPFDRAMCELKPAAWLRGIRADQAVPDAIFERRSCGAGTKGPRISDWAMTATRIPGQSLLIRRLVSRPDQYTFYLCWAPEGRPATMTYFITIAGRRWPAEETFKTGNVSIAHCAFFPSGVLEESSLAGFYLDTQAAAASAADMHGGEFATLDLMQNGLPGDAEGGGGLLQR